MEEEETYRLQLEVGCHRPTSHQTIPLKGCLEAHEYEPLSLILSSYVYLLLYLFVFCFLREENGEADERCEGDAFHRAAIRSESQSPCTGN